MRSIGTGVLFLLFCFAAPVVSKTVYLNVGASFQDSVDANVAGTTYIIRSGVHRLQSVVPKNNDVFIGETGAVMSGAQLLTQWTQSGSYWYCTGQTQAGIVRGDCEDNFPRCGYPEDLYKDDVIMKHEAALADVQAGEYFFDYNADRIYIADNPAGRKLEVCTTPSAFSGTSSNVTIKRIIIEKYATPAQFGAIGGSAYLRRSLVDSCEVRFNHGVGIGLDDHGVISNCYVHHNGQLGLTADGTGVRIENNEISYNRTAGIDVGWEGGGVKFCETDSAVLRNNYVHHNKGPGLWADISCINTLYEGNICDSNEYAGIFHEISYRATIRCNLLRGNAVNKGHSWLWHGQILIASSQDCDVYNNIVIPTPDDGEGITITNQDRPPMSAINNYIHDNHMVLRGESMAGWVTDVDDFASYFASANNRYDYNHYHVENLNNAYWAWNDNDYNWTGFRQTAGQEAHGTIDANLQTPAAIAACAGLSTAIQRPCHEGAKAAEGSRALPTLIVSERLGNISLVVGLDRPQTGRIALYDVQGKIIALLANGMLGSGEVRLQKQGLPNGVYLVRLVTPGFSVAKRVVIAR